MTETKKTTSWVQAVQDRLSKHSSKVEFNDFEHTYTLNSTGKSLTSVSVMLSPFKKGIEDVPADVLEKAQIRGIIIHKVAEWFFSPETSHSYKNMKALHEQVYKYAETIDAYDALEHSYLIENLLVQIDLIMKIQPDLVLTEQLLYDAKTGMAGTADLILFKELNAGRVLVYIIDWKTGNLRPENYAQVSLYQSMLFGALKGLKLGENKTFAFSAAPISLKDNTNGTILELNHD